MSQIEWHKISDYEYPHCFKDVLLLTKSGKYTLGFYNGLKNLECCWFNYLYQEYVTEKSLLAWCELPEIPKELRDVL